MTTTILQIPPLTAREQRELEGIWHDDFSSNLSEGSNTLRWWRVVHTFFARKGAELIPGELRAAEERIMSLGKSQEYLAALADVVQMERVGARTEFDQTMLVLTATAEERRAAVERVLSK